MKTRLAAAFGGITLMASTIVALGQAPASAAYPGKNGRIALSQTSAYGSGWDIWTANRDDTGWKQLTRDGKSTQPSWSPDGTKIAYTDAGAIKIMTSAGKLVRKLTAHGYAATWSPDGKKIAYTWQNAIYAMPSAGGKATKLTTAPAGCGDYHPKWSPISKTDILFTRTCSTNTFLIVNAATKTSRFVTQDGAKGPSDRIDSIDWMPDGKHLAITSYCRDYGACNQIAENVFTTDLTDSHRINVTNEVDQFPDPSDCETQMVDCWGGYYNAIPAPDGKDFIVEWTTPSGMGATVFSTLHSKFYTDDGNGVETNDPSWQRLK